jgi:hypothetical protein
MVEAVARAKVEGVVQADMLPAPPAVGEQEVILTVLAQQDFLVREEEAAVSLKLAMVFVLMSPAAEVGAVLGYLGKGLVVLVELLQRRALP